MIANIQHELAQLLRFSADVATAIRSCTAERDPRTAPQATVDVMWLADAQRNFDAFSLAVLAGDAWQAQLMCDERIDLFTGYKRGTHGVEPDPKVTFDRHAATIRLDTVLMALRSINGKLQAPVDGRVSTTFAAFA